MNRKLWLNLLGLALFVLMPVIARAAGEPFLVNLFTRFTIYAIAAVSLDLILGYGAMVSFGHAAFFGLGGYVIGIVAFHTTDGSGILGWAGTEQALILWPLAIAICALAGLVIGFLSLRTSGVQFIMITLAFGQMFYFILVGLMYYGGDDGLDVVRQVSATALRLLHAGGTLVLEHGELQAAAIAELLTQDGWRAIAHHRDLLGRDRATTALR